MEARLDSARGDPARLLLLLRDMPKGGDLHNHLSGAIYAESYLRWAAEDGLCVTTATLAVVGAPCDPAAGRPPAATAIRNPVLRGQLIDAWSMRNWDPARLNGHDQFFRTFGRFGAATAGRLGDMLAEVAARAAAEGVSYLELMVTPDGSRVRNLGTVVGWELDVDRVRDRLLAAGLRDSAAAGSRAFDQAEARERELLHCGTPSADAGCAVVVRYLYQVLRAGTPGQVFAQILAGFELTGTDPRIVGLNLVQPEDDRVAMADYSLHMMMIGRLHARYPAVPVSLHAGELAPGLVPPEGLRSHIRQAVEAAGARRIGHGVDVLDEDDAGGLLREMAARQVLVEIALSSNAAILGVRGADHPFATYRRYGVPMALVSDDAGVLRTDLTGEFVRAVEEQGADYRLLKRMARNSLEYAFIDGASLWRDARIFEPVTPCAGAPAGSATPACAAFAAGSSRARLQLALEQSLDRFERRQLAPTESP